MAERGQGRNFLHSNGRNGSLDKSWRMVFPSLYVCVGYCYCCHRGRCFAQMFGTTAGTCCEILREIHDAWLWLSRRNWPVRHRETHCRCWHGNKQLVTSCKPTGWWIRYRCVMSELWPFFVTGAICISTFLGLVNYDEPDSRIVQVDRNMFCQWCREMRRRGNPVGCRSWGTRLALRRLLELFSFYIMFTIWWKHVDIEYAQKSTIFDRKTGQSSTNG